jgi:hypothetical protein
MQAPATLRTTIIENRKASIPCAPSDVISNANSGESRPDANVPASRVE